MGHTAEDGAGAAAWRRRARVAGLVLGVLVLLAFLAQSPPRDRHPVFGADRTLNIAHGGAQGHAPGNTVAAFDLALEMGADVLEMDAQLTADRGVVLHHDATVDRQTDGSGAVADLTVEELQRLDAGHGFTGPDGDEHPWRGRGATIPTLDEVLARYPDTPMVIEMKPDGGPGIVEALAERLEAAGRTGDVVVASFDLDLLRELRERLPEVATNMPEDETRTFYTLQLVGLDRWWRAPAGFLQVPEYHDGRHVVTERFVRAADRRGVDVHVWTVNEETDMRRLVELGVHGIMTDRPDRLGAVLDELTPATAVDAADPVRVTRWMQDRLEALTPLMRAVTALGDEDFYLVVFPLLYWSVSRRIGIRVGVMLLLSAGLNAVLKLGSGSARPLFLEPEVGLVEEETFGIPSGHAQNAVAVWGTLAAEVGRRWAWIAAIALMVLLGVSRIHLGAHFPVDTATGWAVGAALLAGYLRWREPVAAWSRREPLARVVLVVLAVSLGIVAAGAVAATGYADWTPPAAWTGPGEAATGLSDVVTPAAALTGLVLGLALLSRRGGFDDSGAVWRRVLRYPVGLVGVLVLWQGLGAVLPHGESVVALTARYLRYTLVGAWIAGGAPLLFVALGLARPAVGSGTGRPVPSRRPTVRVGGSEPGGTARSGAGEATEEEHADG